MISPGLFVMPIDLFNFRDIGGLPISGGGTVASGRLYRAASLHRSRSLESPSFKTVIDLRSARERAAAGEVSGTRSARVLHLPLLDRASGLGEIPDESSIEEFLAEQYMVILLARKEAFREIIRVIAAGELPLVFFCTAGKDRTGIVAAVLLRLLEVPDQLIVEDYSASETPVRELMKVLRAEDREMGHPILDDDSPLLKAPQGAMDMFLADFRHRFKTADEFAKEISLSNDELVGFRSEMTIGLGSPQDVGPRG